MASFVRNISGFILAAPRSIFSVIARTLTSPFVSPEEISATQVALYLFEFLEGFGSDWGWDEFLSATTDNPQLESIRARASQVRLPIDDEGETVLRLLLSEVQNLICETGQTDEPANDTVQYIHLSSNASPAASISHRPFSAVVIISSDVTPEWRHEVSEWLVNEGCMCMMAWGTDCSHWDDSVDIANLEANNWDIPDGQSVMTTWHENEPLSDVFWSAHYSIFEPSNISLEHLVILDINEKARESQIRKLFALACNKIE